MKKLMVLTLTLALIAAMAVTTSNAQQYVHTDTLTETAAVNDIAFKDNETLISVTSKDGIWSTLRSWNVTTGTQRWKMSSAASLLAVALSSHNLRLIAYAGGGSGPNNTFFIRLGDIDHGGWYGNAAEHKGFIYSLAFKPNSSLLASGSRDDTIRIWDVADRGNGNSVRHVRTLRGHRHDVESLAWSPDGRTLASASYDETVRLWNPNNGINFAVLQGHTRSVEDVAWSPDGRILASASQDTTIRIWNPGTLNAKRVLQGHSNSVGSLAFHPDGQTLASGSSDKTIRLWNPNTGAHKATLKVPGPQQSLYALEFSPNGKILACATEFREIHLYRLFTTDVNGDGEVDWEDLVIVAENYGLRNGGILDPKADANGDGKVDIDDLINVAKAVDDAAAGPAEEAAAEEAGAPAAFKTGRALLQAADVRQWIRDAKQANADPAGIAALERLLTELNRRNLPVPKKTVLLANYPNPFNPETWIPYQLAKPAEVKVSIYSADGKLVRTLDLGQVPAGIYQNRSRAAYWNGRNAQGEPVASGVYFYTLQAGDFKATRKMVIRK